jgi:hypothetical protein
MNGLKSGESQDANINFDKWFIWGEGMRKLLVEKCGLNSDILLTSGHLMEDEISNYKYQNTFDYLDLNEKQVISLFSVRGKSEEKLDAFNYFYEFATSNPDVIIIVRPHPNEQEIDMILPNNSLPNVVFLNNDKFNKVTLYDQLKISQLSVCFGSTVALESKWFGVPCITFEMREESLIYLADEKIIFHVKSKNELIEKTQQLLYHEQFVKPQLNSVSNFIINQLEINL